MDSNKLDANVVLVKVNGKDIYFDPGAAFTPFGLLEWSETGVAGLRLDKDGGTWIKSTLPESSESKIQRNAKLRLSTRAIWKGNSQSRLLGWKECTAGWKRVTHMTSERRKYLEDR